MATALATEPTVLSRLDRVDIMLGCLEEIRGTSGIRSSYTSTTSSGSVSAESVDNLSLKSISRKCRSIDDAVAEVQLKGTVLERVQYLESRLIKLEEEMELGKTREEDEISSSPRSSEKGKAHHGIGLKRLVKSCVKGKTKE